MQATDARSRLYDMIGGFRVTQLVRAAAYFGICDRLGSGPKDAKDVASDVKVDAATLRRLMRALSGLGVLEEGEDGRFSNTELGRLLTKDAPGSLYGVSLGLADDAWWQAWAQLPHAIEQNRVATELAHGRTYWEVVADDPAVAARFNRHMVAQTSAFVPQLIEAFDFARSTWVVDVGGGNGAMVAGVLAAHPSLRGSVLDREEGLEGADQYLSAHGVRDRCELVVGDFFEAVPAGADVYVLARVLHDWEDGDAARILATCRRAMDPGSVLLVADQVLPERAVDAPRERAALIADMHMYVLFGARERTEAELRRLLQDGGFTVDRVVPTSPLSVVVAQAV